jgi:hypothetical protein
LLYAAFSKLASSTLALPTPTTIIIIGIIIFIESEEIVWTIIDELKNRPAVILEAVAVIIEH